MWKRSQDLEFLAWKLRFLSEHDHNSASFQVEEAAPEEEEPSEAPEVEEEEDEEEEEEEEE